MQILLHCAANSLTGHKVLREIQEDISCLAPFVNIYLGLYSINFILQCSVCFLRFLQCSVCLVFYTIFFTIFIAIAPSHQPILLNYCFKSILGNKTDSDSNHCTPALFQGTCGWQVHLLPPPPLLPLGGVQGQNVAPVFGPDKAQTVFTK